jgi:adenylosuccinate synthase
VSATVVVGAQWGDEGKAKVIDWLTATRPEIKAIVRYQGGCNAGHTVVHAGKTFKFHLIPSGILDADKICIIGPGTVVMPEILEKELAMLAQDGLSSDKLYISERAHVTLPHHTLLDSLKENDFGPTNKIGTTGRGIGPTYEDKVSRVGLRMGDLFLPKADLEQRLKHILDQKNPIITSRYGLEAQELPELMAWCEKYAKAFSRFIVNTDPLLWDLMASGSRLLLEGAQGTMLDLDTGTYPYVTSSNPTAGGAYIGAGLPPKVIDEVIGITKAYATRVGEGPFPTECFEADGEAMRQIGREFGTTTGRPRRCGWLDLVALKYAARVNGLDSLAITKLDVLSTFETLKLCVGYRNTHSGELLTQYPAQLSVFQHLEPVYQTFPGWQSDLTTVRTWEALPQAARDFLEFIVAQVGVPIAMVSVGPERSETIVCDTQRVACAR